MLLAKAGEAPPTESATLGQGLRFRTLRTFFVLTFGLSWSAGAAYFVFAQQLEPILGEFGYTNPLFILAVYAPAIAAFILVWRSHGIRGVGSFLRRLTLWRMPPMWWVVLLVGIPAANYLGAVFTGTVGDPFPFSPWHAAIPAVLIALSIGPVEEFGWRGVALPLLQRRYTPLTAGLVLGVVWGMWHLPAFFASGTPQDGWSFGPFFLGAVAISVLVTPMFNDARGSLLIPVLLHWQLNNPIWPDALPWVTAIFVVAAAVAVWFNRKTMLTRGAGATDVLHDPVLTRVVSGEQVN